MSYEKPFAGLKVIDLSQGVAGPYAAMLLGQYGANVIKVEPIEGDWSRTLGTRYGDQTAYSVVGNVGKRSIALDLKAEEGRTVLWRLVQGADVFIQGFRPGVIDRLGFGYDAVAAREEKIIYLSVSGFGPVGPLAERPAMDPVLQAYTGLTMENAGLDGIPHRVPIVSIDMSTALYSYGAIATALFARIREPKGRHIEASLLQAAAGLQGIRMMASYLEGGATRAVVPPRGVWPTRDGWINITVVRPWEWSAFCIAMNLPEEPRFATNEGRLAHAPELRETVARAFAASGKAELSERFTAQRVMHEQLNTYVSFLEQEHTRVAEVVRWVQHPGVERAIPLPNVIGAELFSEHAVAPALGQHGADILCEHGYAEDAIEAMRTRGVLGGQS